MKMTMKQMEQTEQQNEDVRCVGFWFVCLKELFRIEVVNDDPRKNTVTMSIQAENGAKTIFRTLYVEHGLVNYARALYVAVVAWVVNEERAHGNEKLWRIAMDKRGMNEVPIEVLRGIRCANLDQIFDKEQLAYLQRMLYDIIATAAENEPENAKIDDPMAGCNV